MKAQLPGDTLLIPRAGQRRLTSTGLRTTALAPELLTQSVRRLRVLAFLYAFTFFMAGFFPSLLVAEDRARLFQETLHWVPGVVSIAMALLVAAFTLMKDVPLTRVLNVGLAFEIVSSYGIALAEYIEPMRLNTNGWMGLSWVAVWTVLFTVLIPTRPRKAALATLASVSAVPVVIGVMVAAGRTTFRPDPFMFFLGIVLPYLLVTIMGYVGARAVYTLGKAVTEARELGSYQLVERLGRGGMGEVWRARHRLLARPAAIKLIRTTDSGAPPSDDAISRFEREAHVTATLSSPHTVQLFDFGVADDGTFYYVMELLNGLDLETLVGRHGALPAERVIYLLRQACRSLAEAEVYGLVHRDIKPANLFVCRYAGEDDFVKVLDFGIAKVKHGVMETGVLELTRDNVIRGTPTYIAPEQALGAEIDSRADIYSLGCVAYFLLTGEPVFAAETPLAMAVHHVHTMPAPPSSKSEVPIPPGLDLLIMECLAKDRVDRPQSARELSRRLGEIVSPNPWTEERAREWWEMHQPQAGTQELRN
jgi:eukaryotic-like serine/threonine-protein kinase